ncbi:hypothetical protein BVRB_6g154850 [Beta vulgaris subsp. vulgaris]|nr:hypothetical protein BVRB_6g154850 [Beta vulgaris subsp. vulgaris]
MSRTQNISFARTIKRFRICLDIQTLIGIRKLSEIKAQIPVVV